MKINFAKQSLVGASLFSFVAYFFSAGLGYVREAVTANYFGTSSLMDTFVIAFTVPEFVASVLYSCLPTAIIPLVKKAMVDDDQDHSKLFWSGFFNFTTILGIFVVAFILFREQILLWIDQDLNSAQFALGQRLTLLLSFYIFFKGLEIYFRGWLFEKKHFITPMTMGIVQNVIVILSLVLFRSKSSIEALAYGWLISSIFLCLYHGFVTLKLMGIKFKWSFYDPWLRSLYKSLLFIAVIESISQLFVVADRYFAGNFLDAGYISSLRYAFILVLLPNRLFVITFSSISFPFIADLFKDNDYKKLKKLYLESINIIIFAIGVIGIGLAVFSQDFIAIVFKRGAFDEESLRLTSPPFIIYSLALVFQSIYVYQMRFYYAIQRYKRLGIIKLIMFLTKIIFSALLISRFLHLGLAFATAISWVLGFIMMNYDMGKKLKVSRSDIVNPVLMKTIINILITSAFWYAANYYYPEQSSFIGIFVKLTILGLLGIVSYLWLAYMFKLPQFNTLRRVIGKRISFPPLFGQ